MYDIFISKKTELTNVSELTSLPDDFTLYQNYLNPFNLGTIISWQSPVAGHQTLKVYNILGRELKTLVNEQKSAGTYRFSFNAKNIPSGVYFYTLQSGSVINTKKMLILK